MWTGSDFSDVWFFGCNNGTGTPIGAGWNQVRFNLATQGFRLSTGRFEPFVGPTTYIEIVFDEGTDVGPGSVQLDNIDINGTLITNNAGTTLQP